MQSIRFHHNIDNCKKTSMDSMLEINSSLFTKWTILEMFFLSQFCS